MQSSINCFRLQDRTLLGKDWRCGAPQSIWRRGRLQSYIDSSIRCPAATVDAVPSTDSCRRKYVQECYDRQWRDSCDDARTLDSQAHTDWVASQRWLQVAEKAARSKASFSHLNSPLPPDPN